MALGIDEVRRIAALARLELKPAEAALFVEQLSDIVDYVDQLREFETGEPRSREDSLIGNMACTEPAAPEADDTAADTLPHKSFLANAPQVLDGYLVVPRVMDPSR
ncbi:MAG: Asp-tRNA(Asn)/Glu-tRNA(Gln) amidotransferase subunit GatC [bacterium]|nr:Asp-tRNA(Asn)/Glu-tRNA(Gln) amidotransferase subunit GatC [bacterium]